MSQRPVIAALLDTGDSFLHLEQQKTDTETAEGLGYSEGKIRYSEYVEKALQTGEQVPNYHSVAEKLVENPSILYENDLLRDEAMRQIDEGLQVLAANRDRSLNDAEVEAVVTTAMNDTEAFPRRAIDKGEVVDNLYIEVYSDERPGYVDQDEPIP